MKYAYLLLALTSACASAEMRSADGDPANPSATVAALDLGTRVLSSSFSPDANPPAPGQAADPHAGHEMGDPHAGHTHAPPAETTTEPPPGHEAPVPSASTTSRPKVKPKPSAAQPAATSYTCMHHPEVVSTSKGQCPKCGMDLVPQKPAAGPAKP